MSNKMAELGMNDREKLAAVEGAAMLLVEAINEAGPRALALAVDNLAFAGTDHAVQISKRPIYRDLAKLIRRAAK